MPDLTLDDLSKAIADGAAAFRSRVTLQPAGGEGSKVFPPTYAGSVYASEKRRLPDYDEPVECVLLDSVQSQANRMEEALQQAVDDGQIAIPVVEVDFSSYFPGDDELGKQGMRLLDPVGKVSSLQAPHRIADAILRDSLLDGVPFRQTEVGGRLGLVGPRDATALFEICPTALVFGMWDSTGPKGGLGAKFERAMVSEIVGINAIYGVKTSSRIDPLGIQRDAGPVYAAAESGIGWTLEESGARQEKKKPVMLGKTGRPSEANHGNVTPDFTRYSAKSIGKENRETIDPMRTDGSYITANRVSPGGVTIDRAEQMQVLSLAGLRRLRFPVDGKYDAKVDHAARTTLAALGLCAAALAAESGLDLRSRCLLWPTDKLSWELLGRPGSTKGDLTLNADAAMRLLAEAVKQARGVGLPWRADPLVLAPSDELVKLVVKSQQLAAQQGGEVEEGP